MTTLNWKIERLENGDIGIQSEIGFCLLQKSSEDAKISVIWEYFNDLLIKQGVTPELVIYALLDEKIATRACKKLNISMSVFKNRLEKACIKIEEKLKQDGIEEGEGFYYCKLSKGGFWYLSKTITAIVDKHELWRKWADKYL